MPRKGSKIESLPEKEIIIIENLQKFMMFYDFWGKFEFMAFVCIYAFQLDDLFFYTASI